MEIQDPKSGKFAKVATADSKRFDVETRLILNLLNYFKNDPDDRPTNASPLERGRNERCNVIKRKDKLKEKDNN